MSDSLIQNLCKQANEAFSKGHVEDARELYLEALQIQPNAPDVHYGLATIYYLRQDWGSAAHHFQKVTRHDPTRASAFINLGAVYNKLEKLDEAVKVLRKGIKFDVNRAEGYYNLGLVYRRQGNNELAIQAYREAAKINPRMTDAHYNLANLYLERQDYNLALVHYQKAVELRPTWEKAKNGLAAARAALEESPPQSAVPVENTVENDPTTIYQSTATRDEDVDPEKHGKTLVKLHKSIIESQQDAHDFARILHDELEISVRDLSGKLLKTHATTSELKQSVEDIDNALAHMEKSQSNLDKIFRKIQKYSDRLLQG